MRRTRSAFLAAASFFGLSSLVIAASFGGCSFAWDGLDPRLGGGGIGGSGGMPGVGGGGGQGGFGEGGAGGGAGGEGGQGGSGGQAPVLVDRGLLTRYYIDEAASGEGPTTLVDSAPDPLALDLDYGSVGGVGGGGGAGGAPAGPPNMGFVEVNGHRGLRWSIADQSGKASAVVGGTKILGIDGATAATIEAVVAVEGGLPGTVCERIAHIGTNSNGSLTLCSEDGQRLDLRVNTMNGPFWSVGLPSLGRVVVHVVLDSSEALAPDRAKLYLDGALVPASGGTPIPPGLTVALTFGEYAIGNRVDSAASQQGTIFYLAHYLTALTEQEVVNNAQVLAVSDDHP